MNNYPELTMWTLLFAWFQAIMLLAYFYHVPTLRVFGAFAVLARYILIATSGFMIIVGSFVLLDKLFPPVEVIEEHEERQNQ